MVNNAISLFHFLVFETNMSLDVICVLQGKNIELCMHFSTPSPIGIMPLISVFQAINLYTLFLRVILVYKFHLLKKIPMSLPVFLFYKLHILRLFQC